jgi:septal ring factor EnvC (AmiA/AmiB activator)
MRTRLLTLALLLTAGVLMAEERPMSYIYKRGEGLYTRISGAAIDRIGDVAKKYGDEFVWVRVSGRNYVIRDAAALAEVRGAFAAVEAMEPSLHAIEQRMKPFEREMEKIEERVDSLGDRLDDESLSESARDAIEDRLHAAENEMRAVEDKMQVVEREMERIENESEKREAAAEDRFEEIVERAIARGVAERVR